MACKCENVRQVPRSAGYRGRPRPLLKPYSMVCVDGKAPGVRIVDCGLNLE